MATQVASPVPWNTPKALRTSVEQVAQELTASLDEYTAARLARLFALVADSIYRFGYCDGVRSVIAGEDPASGPDR